MSDVACGVHALDKLIHDECVYCLRARIAARDKQVAEARAACEAYSRICVCYRIGIPPKDSDLDCVRAYNTAAAAAGGGDE
jgi:hypothetical protein